LSVNATALEEVGLELNFIWPDLYGGSRFVPQLAPPFPGSAPAARTHRGDCEDYAIVKYIALLQAGLSPDDAHTALHPAKSSTGHALRIALIRSGSRGCCGRHPFGSRYLLDERGWPTVHCRSNLVSAHCLYFRSFHVAWRHDVVALPRGLPHRSRVFAYFSVVIANCLKSLVGAPGLEPGTR
jgi:hypothetical protein